jgi:uncharacterized protein
MTLSPSAGGWTSFKCSLLAAAFACSVLVGVSAAAQDLPVPRTHVADYAQILDPQTEARLDAILTELEQKTTCQVVVLTVKTTGGQPISDFTLATAERWKLGQKGKDNGMLICVAVADRKYWITVGYGLESITPDSFCGTVGRRYFVPNFRQGRFAQGLYDGTLVLVQEIAKAHHVTISGVPQQAIPAPSGRRPLGLLAGCCSSLFPLLIFLIFFGSILRGRRRGLMFWGLPLLLSTMGGSRRGGLGGGGWGGGGFGSFGGGGGGSFGGGGAGGGW